MIKHLLQIIVNIFSSDTNLDAIRNSTEILLQVKKMNCSKNKYR
jgi:hypothetical protein